jgi:DNA-binding beta-propeller fold protein YncE
MKRKFIYSTIIVLFAAAAFAAARINRVGIQQVGQYLIPTGQLLTPAGDHVEVNDRPLGMVLSPDGQTLIVCTGSNFNPRAIHLLDVSSKTIKQTIPIGDSFVGIVLNKAGTTLYVGGGTDNNVKIF